MTRYAARRGIRFGFVGAVLAFLTAACTGLPTGSLVQPGRRVDEDVANPVRVVQAPPAPGASPEEIVRGFVNAGAAFQDGDENQRVVGTAYLAPGSVDTWRPTSSVTVFDRTTPVEVTVTAEGRATVSTSPVAVVDDAGRYREVTPGGTVQADFQLVLVDGEWRIVLPDAGFGLWLNTDDFGRVFAPHAVHYTAPGGRLVPDVRWFPGGPRLVTALARAQLGPVPAYLRGAVETGVPDGTTLAVAAVPVQDGVATVVLSSKASTADLAHRRAIWAQLVQTLTQTGTVRAVSIDVQGAGRLAIPDVTSPVSSVEALGFADHRVAAAQLGVLRRGDRLTWVDPSRIGDPGGSVPAVNGPALPSTVPPGYRELAVSVDGSDVAAVAGDLLTRWRAGILIGSPAFGTELTRPAYDSHGRLWVGGLSGATTRIWSLDASTGLASAPQPLSVPWLAGGRVRAVAVSPEASRLAIVSTGADGTGRLDVLGIVRDVAWVPTSLAVPYRQGWPLRQILDVTWVDERTLAVLGRVAESDPVRPYVVDLGQGIGLLRHGTVDPGQLLLSPVPGARTITTTGGVRGLVVTTSDAVFVRVGAAWRLVAGASELALAAPH